MMSIHQTIDPPLRVIGPVHTPLGGLLGRVRTQRQLGVDGERPGQAGGDPRVANDAQRLLAAGCVWLVQAALDEGRFPGAVCCKDEAKREES
jgi:hypothetical protein